MPEYSAIAVLSLWVGAHTLLMLGLALNVTRNRLKGEKVDQQVLEKAIRAHGNNIEYVPVILLGIALLAVNGIQVVWIHVLCGLLFFARILHAIGIQQSATLPPSRVLGNLGTWTVMLVTAVLLVMQFFL